MIRALLVDDDPLMGNILSFGLSGSGIECVHLTSYEQAVEYIDGSLYTGRKPEKKPRKGDGAEAVDVVILDYYLNNGKTGLSLCKKIRVRSELPVVMLTGEKSVKTTVMCLEEGADQYVCKPFILDELVARINASIRSRKIPQLAAPAKNSPGIKINVNEREFKFGGSSVSLTEKESLLAEVLLHNVDRPVTKEDIFEHVYGRFAGIHSRCLDMLVGRLRKKLALTGNKCRIFSVRNLGYKMVVKVNV
jgi:DNA-binding response OmpR family regulator